MNKFQSQYMYSNNNKNSISQGIDFIWKSQYMYIY